jgi:DnaJ family protein C protein 11
MTTKESVKLAGSRTATDEEISAAYKRLSRMYHPDKHLEEEKRKTAEIMFNKLKNAYEGEQI